MARKRTIDPEFWVDEDVAKLSIPARLLFIGLWSLADDMGNLIKSIARIKAQLFPYDNFRQEKVESWLVELEGRHGKRFILPYSVAGIEYYHIPNFLKHQTINRPTPSKLPPFSEDSVSAPDTFTENSSPREKKLNKEKRRERELHEFLAYAEELRPQFPFVDFGQEFKKCLLWWSEGQRKCKRPKTALLNWMQKADRFRQEREPDVTRQDDNRVREEDFVA